MLLNLHFLKKIHCRSVLKLYFIYIFVVSCLLSLIGTFEMSLHDDVMFHPGAHFGKVLTNLLKFGICLLHMSASQCIQTY